MCMCVCVCFLNKYRFFSLSKTSFLKVKKKSQTISHNYIRRDAHVFIKYGMCRELLFSWYNIYINKLSTIPFLVIFRSSFPSPQPLINSNFVNFQRNKKNSKSSFIFVLLLPVSHSYIIRACRVISRCLDWPQLL